MVLIYFKFMHRQKATPNSKTNFIFWRNRRIGLWEQLHKTKQAKTKKED